MNTESSLSGIN